MHGMMDIPPCNAFHALGGRLHPCSCSARAEAAGLGQCSTCAAHLLVLTLHQCARATWDDKVYGSFGSDKIWQGLGMLHHLSLLDNADNGCLSGRQLQKPRRASGGVGDTCQVLWQQYQMLLWLV